MFAPARPGSGPRGVSDTCNKSTSLETAGAAAAGYQEKEEMICKKTANARRSTGFLLDTVEGRGLSDFLLDTKGDLPHIRKIARRMFSFHDSSQACKRFPPS